MYIYVYMYLYIIYINIYQNKVSGFTDFQYYYMVDSFDRSHGFPLCFLFLL